MKRLMIVLVWLMSSLLGMAQESMTTTMDTTEVMNPTYVPVHYRYSGMESVWAPMGYYGGMGYWPMHEGFNGSLDAGVSVGFGKNNPWKGAAFFTDFAGLYAHQFNDRLTVAGGLYLRHLTGWGTSTNQLGLFGLVNYQINNRLDLTGYIAHDFGNLGGDDHLGKRPMMWPGYGKPSTTVGADLGIKVNESVKLGVGVSFTHEEGNHQAAPQGLGLTHQQMQDVHKPLER